MRRKYVPEEYIEMYHLYCRECIRKKRKTPTFEQFGKRVVSILKKNKKVLLQDETIKF